MAEQNRQKNAPWSDIELQVAVDAYLYMLQLEISGIPFSETRQERLLFSGPLSNRSDASVRYRMRNISCVMQERGVAILRAYSPAPQVGRNVKSRIHGLLDARHDTLAAIRRLAGERRSGSVELDDVVANLEQLKDRISKLVESQRAFVGIGHNNPPEKIEIDANDFINAIRAIEDIEEELASESPDKNAIASRSDILVSLGMKSVAWAGQRLTDFARAGAVAAGTGFGLAVSGLGGKIIETLQQVFDYLF